jgi:SAM-dependent methyltransferase
MTVSNVLNNQASLALEAAGNYRNLIFSETDDRQRLRQHYIAIRPLIMRQFERVLDEFGLAQRLRAASIAQTGPGQRQVAILDFGCNEGWYLQDFAAMLEQRGLSNAAELFGIDNNPQAISTAEEFNKVVIPARPYLHFYTHDGRNPMEECSGLSSHPSCGTSNTTDELTSKGEKHPGGQPQFDFIFALLVLEHIQEVRPILERLYRENLKPGGVIYLFESEIELTHYSLNAGRFHPTLSYVISRVLEMIALNNQGANVSREQAGWLSGMGAERVTTQVDGLDIGGSSEAGMAMLRGFVMATQNMGPGLVKKGLLAQDEFDKMMSSLYQELSQEVQGQMSFVHTLARKPNPAWEK